ncbi:helix-turn-helix domain-containing protein [Flavobacterium sp. 7A]|uniref:helix-turn-helix domain-containing protein n=1 Tax=Flavobacterium sp. 7A TaxID=2940571 RepID=UPI0022270966|nr:helix-turn-helix transcriptional regulator [Flavobacterium sp. 7A]MCW2120831.1 transcriptional regulator with XRE-family HTH domain [Flavobacterium sp. 7A]
MVNTEDFIKRLEVILEYHTLNASAFADKIGVQRSSLSHLLSGRNKPSLDFILKILEEFPEVDLYWLLNGTGTFPKSDITETNTPNTPLEIKKPPVDLFSEEKQNDAPPTFEKQKGKDLIQTIASTTSEVEKIVVFYTNGTFKSYIPE